MALEQLEIFDGTFPDKANQEKSIFANSIRDYHIYLERVGKTINPLIDKLNPIFANVGNHLLYTNYKGDYSAATTYAVGDSITSGGSVYFSKIDENLNSTPPSVDWFPASISSYGTAIDNTYSNATSGLAATNCQDAATELSNATGGKYEFVASGALTSGDVVKLRTDGKVEVITFADDTFTSPVYWGVGRSSAMHWHYAAYSPTSNKVVVVYNNPTDRGVCVVGTVSSGAITFGTSVEFNSTETSYINIGWDSLNDVFIVTYRDDDNGYHGMARVGTVSGTTISFGTAVQFQLNQTDYSRVIYDDFNDKIVITYCSSSDFKAIVGTVSGTTISFGTSVLIDSVNPSWSTAAVFDKASNKVVVAYLGDCIVGTVSGDTISFGTKATFNATMSATNYCDCEFIPTLNKIVLVYTIGSSTSEDLYAIVGTVSGTSISFGTEYFVADSGDNTASAKPSVSYDSTRQQPMIVYPDHSGTYGADYGLMAYGTLSGTDISFDTPLVYHSTSIECYGNIVYNTVENTPVILSRYQPGQCSMGGFIVTPAWSTNEDWIGISKNTVANGQTATVDILGGINENQTGLTTGSDYFVDTDGTLTTTDTGYPIGTALSATKLIVKGNG